MLQPSFMSASPTLSHDTPVDQPPDRLPWQEQHSPRLYSLGRALPKNTIRFKCLDCGRPMEARAQDGGVDTNCPRTHPRYAETFARRIDRGTQRTGDQHRNLLAPFPSLLDDSAAVRTDWFILEFASSQRPSHHRAATLHRVRGYAVFAAPD